MEDNQESKSLEIPKAQNGLLNATKYSLFEEYLSFLSEEKDAKGDIKMLNPVLLGYWCNLFRSLVQTHPQEVFIYVYEHQEVLDKMLNHLYSPQMSDIFVRLLNFNESVFTRKSSADSMQSSNVELESLKSLDNASLAAARVIRQGTIFSIIERLGTDYSFDQ